MEMFFAFASFLIAVSAFIFGAAKLFNKKKPLYLQLFVCAAGCFAIEQLAYAVNVWCSVTAMVSVDMLGIFGCNFFLLSANYGTLDRIVDDGRGTGKARKLAFLAPALMAVLSALVFFAWKDKNLFCAVTCLIVLLPALPASYFNLKHILLPIDPFAFLRATKACNVSALVFYFLTAAYGFCLAAASLPVIGVLSVLLSLSAFALALCAVKGAERWGI